MRTAPKTTKSPLEMERVRLRVHDNKILVKTSLRLLSVCSGVKFLQRKSFIAYSTRSKDLGNSREAPVAKPVNI